MRSRIVVSVLGLAVVSCGRGTPSPATPPTTVVTAESFELVIDPVATLVQGDADVPATASLRRADGSRVPDASVKCDVAWTAVKPDVLRITPEGRMSAVSAGDAAIDAACGPLHAETSVHVRELLVVRGVVQEQFAPVAVAGAVVTVMTGPDQGRQAVTGPDGAFSLPRLAEPGVTLEIRSPDFDARTATLQANISGGQPIQLSPRFVEETFTVFPPDALDPPSPSLLPFEMKHAGPVTVTVHSDCVLRPYSFGYRFGVFITQPSGTREVQAGLAWGEGPREEIALADASATAVLPAGTHVRSRHLVLGVDCRSTATTRHPL